MPTGKSPTGKKDTTCRPDPFARRDDPDYHGPSLYPRIGGYGGYGAEPLAAALCRVCPDDVHGHVEVFSREERVEVRVGLVCGATHTIWKYAVTCDPWEVTGAVQDAVVAVWRSTRGERCA